jgi:hypothetical protein
MRFILTAVYRMVGEKDSTPPSQNLSTAPHDNFIYYQGHFHLSV